MGLRLPRRALRVLRERGIFAQASIGLHYQNLAKRYVVRGVESGGAAADVGRYVTFAHENGEPIECLHPVESIGVNGPHAVVVAPVLVRLDMLRKGRTYELLITRHAPGPADRGQRPSLLSLVVVRGVHGRLEGDLSGGNKAHANGALPTFYSLAGEEVPIPPKFESAVRSLVNAVQCSACSHSHYVVSEQKKRRRITEHEAVADFREKTFSGKSGNIKETKMNDVIGSVRQVLQDFLAPELRQHRAELVAIRSELTTKIEAAESRLDGKIDSVASRLDAVESRLDSKIEVLKSEVRSGFSALGAALENAVLRGELSTTREIADLRIRVERLEKERGQLPQ